VPGHFDDRDNANCCTDRLTRKELLQWRCNGTMKDAMTFESYPR